MKLLKRITAANKFSSVDQFLEDPYVDNTAKDNVRDLRSGKKWIRSFGWQEPEYYNDDDNKLLNYINNNYSYADYHRSEMLENGDLIAVGKYGEYDRSSKLLYVDLPSKLSKWVASGRVYDDEVSQFLSEYTFLSGYDIITDSSCVEISEVAEEDAKKLCKDIRSCLMDLQNDI